MTLFRYEARDRTGKVVRGVMNACDELQVQQKLAAMGYSASCIYNGSGKQASGTSAKLQTSQQAAPSASQRTFGGMQSVTLASGIPVSIKSKVPASALAAYFRQLATLVKSGMPLHLALSDLGSIVRNHKLKRTIFTMQEFTQGGKRLSGAMAEYPDIFPVHTIASVWAGELSGKLEIALDEIASDMEKEASDTRWGRIGWGLIKVHVIGGIILIPMLNFNSIIAPIVEKSFAGTGTLKPGEALRIMTTNYFNNIFWKTMLAAIITLVGWVVWGYLKRIPSIRYMLDNAMLYVPLWGNLHKTRAKGRFLRVLDQLYDAGIQPEQAWDAACLTARNSAIAGKLRAARSKVPQNAGINELIAASGAFEPEEAAMVASGERSGQINSVLSNMASICEDRAATEKVRDRSASVFLMIVFFGAFAIVSTYLFSRSYGQLLSKILDYLTKGI